MTAATPPTRQFQSAMSGRAPTARPQASGLAPQLMRHPVQPGTTSTTPTTDSAMAARKAERAAMARAQSNPVPTKAAAMTRGPAPPAARPKAAVGAAPPPATSLTSAAAGMPARMMKKGGLVRKGNVSHGQYTKKC
jgi:hypothetical protein